MNSRQFIKLLSFITFFSFIAYLGELLWQDNVISIINGILLSAPYLLAATTTIVIFLVKYTDSIATSLSEFIDEKRRKNIIAAQKSFSDLSKESISNIILCLVLFILLKAVNLNIFTENLEKYLKLIYSLKFSFIMTMIYITINQIIALHTVMNYRKLIEINKENKKC